MRKIDRDRKRFSLLFEDCTFYEREHRALNDNDSRLIKIAGNNLLCILPYAIIQIGRDYSTAFMIQTPSERECIAFAN